MRRLEAAIAIVGSALWLSGCATSALEMAPERPDRPWAPITSADGEIIAGEKGHANAPDGYVLPLNTALANVPAPPGIDSAKTYDLPDLIDLAESSNPTTRIAWDEARRVALAAGIAESAYLPKVTASAVAAYQASDAHSSALGTSVANNSVNGTVSAVSMQWLLFDFGERSAVVDAAKQASVISNIAFTEAHQLVIYNVTLAFYANAAAQAHVATATQSLKNAQTVQAAAEDRYHHGIGTVIELAQARQGAAQANLAVVQATGAAQDAYFALISAMGISPLTKIRAADVSGRKLSPAMAASVESIVSASLGRRPDVLSAYAAQKASLASVRAARAEFMPKVFLSATGSYNSAGVNLTALPGVGQQGASTVNITGSRFSGTVLAGVTVPLFDGGTRAATLEQARAEVDSADARLQRVREEAVRQIVFADNALRTSLGAYSASETLVSAAQTTFDAALAAYRNGVGSITDLTLAETQLLQAKNASTDAYSTALSSAASLALSTGLLGAAPP
ncbi:MAG TPA: TolC family protein [Caulobacteraceae bacterium]|jgi:outer membrane protein TolC|nr:TolC family protein [Caulobacteraceae bacterium]